MSDSLDDRESDIFEHKKIRVRLDNERTISRLFHLGTMKNCPLCKQVQEKALSQIREFRFRFRNREVLQVVASETSGEDEDGKAVWDTLMYHKVEGLTKEFLEQVEKMVQSDVGGGSIITGTDSEIERVIDTYRKKRDS